MDRHGVRYLFEHRLLPQFFFTETENFIGTLLSEKDVLYRIIDSLFRKEDLENPYTAGQFSAEAAKITEQILMIKITFPKPEEAPLCYRTYLFFDTDFGKLGYYSVEKNSGIIDDEPFVCSWSRDGQHRNYGNCSLEDDEDFRRCLEIHLKTGYGTEK